MTPRAVLQPARFAGAAVLRTQSDARLIDMTRAGNDRAFEAIVERYHGPLLRYCARVLTPARAEDALQQALVNAYRALTRSEEAIDLRPWLFRIVHNAALNALRAAGPAVDELSDDVHEAADGPEPALERRERLRSVVASVNDLPDNQRAAVLLQALDGHTHDEIARALGLSGGSVRQLLHRARVTLRAAATAFTPVELLNRLTVEAWAAPAAQRVAELTAGAGLAAGGVAKAGVALLSAGAIAGGATGALPVPVLGLHDGGGAKAVAAVAPGDGREPDDPEALAFSPAGERELDRGERSAARRARAERRRERRAEERREEREERREERRERERDDDDRDSGSEHDEDDRSGRGGGEDRSGSGGGGSGSGDDDPDWEGDQDNSGSGSGGGSGDDEESGQVDEPDTDPGDALDE